MKTPLLLASALFVFTAMVVVPTWSWAGERAPADDPDVKAVSAAASAIFGFLARNDFPAFEKAWLVDQKRYQHYYKERHGIEIAERSWREFLDGVKNNFGQKAAALGDGKPVQGKSECAKEGKFKSCEVWMTLPGKQPDQPGEMILQFIRIRGEWKVTSLE
jgi:hypothetical protein